MERPKGPRSAPPPSPEDDPRFMATIRAMLSTPASKVPKPGKSKPAKTTAKRGLARKPKATKKAGKKS